MALNPAMKFGERIPNTDVDPFQGFDIQIEDAAGVIDMGGFCSFAVDYELKKIFLERGLLKQDLPLLPVEAVQEIPELIRLKFVQEPGETRSYLIKTPGTMRLTRFAASSGRTVVGVQFTCDLLDLTAE